MTIAGLGLGAPVQIAYAVPDVVEHAASWVRDLGAGPFFVRRHIPVSDVVHRGTPAVFDHSAAYGQWGSLMIELVQDHGTGPSAIRDMYMPEEAGLHHLAFFVADLDATTATLGAAGYPLAMQAVAHGAVRFNFIDAVASLGHMIELYEPTEHLTNFYAMVADAAKTWDGAEPVRIM